MWHFLCLGKGVFCVISQCAEKKRWKDFSSATATHTYTLAHKKRGQGVLPGKATEHPIAGVFDLICRSAVILRHFRLNSSSGRAMKKPRWQPKKQTLTTPLVRENLASLFLRGLVISTLCFLVRASVFEPDRHKTEKWDLNRSLLPSLLLWSFSLFFHYTFACLRSSRLHPLLSVSRITSSVPCVCVGVCVCVCLCVYRCVCVCRGDGVGGIEVLHHLLPNVKCVG